MRKARDTVFMETTEVPPERSAAEIASCLIRAGATQIATEYDNGRIVGLRFTLTVGGQPLTFELPARTEPVYKLLVKRSRSSYLTEKEKTNKRAQAERVGWRQLLRWVQAQLAMMDVGMVSAHEVFFPYMFDGKRTLVQQFEQDTLRLLPAASEAKGAGQ